LWAQAIAVMGQCVAEERRAVAAVVQGRRHPGGFGLAAQRVLEVDVELGQVLERASRGGGRDAGRPVRHRAPRRDEVLDPERERAVARVV